MSNELREFLVTRRARINPQQAGLPVHGTRRVPGLRRGEVASLSGVSVEYYAKLERGTAAGVSDSVLHAIADALRLDDTERSHLFDLVRAAAPARRARARSRTDVQRVRPGVLQLIDAMTDVAAVVQNGRMDILAANALGRALYAEAFEQGATSGRLPNHARFAFLDPRAQQFYPDWDSVASDGVAILRAQVGRHPDDRELSELVGDLATKSQAFSTLWASYTLRSYPPGTKRFHHGVVGDLELTYEALTLNFDQGLYLMTYTPEPGSASQDAMRLLASWAAASAQDARLG